VKLEIGLTYLRSELHQNFGGNPRAGICPTRSGAVLVFSDPPAGARFGYQINDEVVDDVYRYTGEGRLGHQQLVRGNKALLEADEILLFSRVDSRSWSYIGEVSLGDPPYEITEAPDQAGNLRSVLVFRFKAKSANLDLLAGKGSGASGLSSK
jgi:5-methylcytosine-specific restriction protein A